MSEREIVIEFGEGWWIVLIPVLILIVLGLTLLGKQVTPEGASLLTPSRWQLMKAERSYEKELGLLRSETEALVNLLNHGPNPVEAGLTADRIHQETLDGHTALGLQREAVANASEMVRLWAMGGAAREEAEAALAEAVSALKVER